MRPLAIAWALLMISCGPIGIALLFIWADRGDLSRGVFDLLVGLVVCAFGIGNLYREV